MLKYDCIQSKGESKELGVQSSLNLFEILISCLSLSTDPELTQAKLRDPNHDARLINYFPSLLISIGRIITSNFEYNLEFKIMSNQVKSWKGWKSRALLNWIFTCRPNLWVKKSESFVFSEEVQVGAKSGDFNWIPDQKL